MTSPYIHIAAALIYNTQREMLLVRKADTPYFMQAGGKLEADERPIDALRRELNEELGIDLIDQQPVYLGNFSAAAANEPGCQVVAELFALQLDQPLQANAEIAEARWVSFAEAERLTLAELTREQVLPLARQLLSHNAPLRTFAFARS